MDFYYENFEELQEHDSEIAASLLEEVGKGEWQNNGIEFFPDLEDFADYELNEGWYFEMNIDRDYNGAPNIYDFIDLKALGQALEENWDESIYRNIDGSVVMTTYGW